LPERLTRSKAPLHAGRIEDYAVIGDCETAALVSRTGSIDWLCWPAFSSGACFAALLGTADHGFWKIAPIHKKTVVQRQYQPGTTVVETTFETPDGAVCLVDFMPPREGHSHVVRLVRGIRGKVKMRMDLAIRFDYGRTVPWVTHEKQGLHAIAGPDMVVLRTAVSLRGEGFSTVSEFTVRAGETLSFCLTYASSMGGAGTGKTGNDPVEMPPVLDTEAALARTQAYWREWASRNQYEGAYAEAVARSLMTLKLMTYNPSGGVVAAVTMGLPEKIGGPRNWDYRYCWLRDTSFTLLCLLQAGYREEAEAWRRWLLRAIAGSPEQIQSIYGICGERQLVEWQADWLPGYEHSQPVLIGNGAAGQFQLDVFGEMAAALLKMPEAQADIKVSATGLLSQTIDHLCHVWEQPDQGIWEVRGAPRHFTHSKVMAWTALDRAIQHHELYDGGGDVKRWKKNRDLLHKQICDKGFNKKLNSFTQSYGSKDLDASCLRIVMVGFLPPTDPRIVGTVEAIERSLLKDGLVLRYNTNTAKDGFPPGEGVFLACSFWLVTNLWLIGRRDDARKLFERLLGLCNDVGLLSEEYDPVANRMLGNFPQALSHLALVHAAFTMAGRWMPQGMQPAS
jgi:GH15 family glucan-1,4-alpha-glucosidase